MRDGRQIDVVLEHEVDAILADPDKITLVAQPIIDLARASVVGYEILTRFALGRPVGPDRVFAAAVRAGRGTALDALVVERALAVAARRPANCFVTINVDPIDLGTPEMDRVLAQRDLRGLAFELTEHYPFDDADAIQRALAQLRAQGAIIALDDAGAGYSGLKQILELKPEILKLDRALVTNIHANEAKRALVQMLGELAARLDAWMLAEGIETAEEADALVKLGVPLAQGYFFARPAPPWAGIAPGASVMLGATTAHGQRRRRHTSLERVIAPCVVTTDRTAWPADSRVTILLDEARVPLMMQIRGEGGERQRSAHELMRVKRDAALTEVARRAMARTERLRWDPLVCIDDRGGFEGIVAMERLLDALADTCDHRVTGPLTAAATGLIQVLS